MNFLADIWNRAAKEVASEDHRADPEYTATDVVHEIGSIRHPGGTGNRRAERANDRDESCQNHGLPTVLLIKIMSALQVSLLEKHRIFATVERSSRAATDPVANLVAYNCAKHDWQEQPLQSNHSSRGKHASGHQQGIARQEKSNKESGLDEYDEGNHPRHIRACRADQPFDIKQVVEQVTDVFEQGTSNLSRSGSGTFMRESKFKQVPQPIR